MREKLAFVERRNASARNELSGLDAELAASRDRLAALKAGRDSARSAGARARGDCLHVADPLLLADFAVGGGRAPGRKRGARLLPAGVRGSGVLGARVAGTGERGRPPARGAAGHAGGLCPGSHLPMCGIPEGACLRRAAPARPARAWPRPNPPPPKAQRERRDDLLAELRELKRRHADLVDARPAAGGGAGGGGAGTAGRGRGPGGAAGP
jgi:hypothetical protein